MIRGNRAVIYCRVSTREQVDEGNSLVTQERSCRDYAFKNNLEIIETFVEKGESAKSADRTEFQNLLRFCNDKKNKISTVIIYKIDRFARNMEDYISYKMFLRKCGVELKSVTEQFKNDSTGKFTENLMAMVAQLDNDVRSERCGNGMKDAVREGRYVWMAPVGYRNTKIAGKSNIEPDGQALLIKEIFELASRGLYPTTTIHELITEKGLVGKNGKPISRSYFQTLLRNELYAGWINKFDMRVKGLFTPIVSDELFQTVQTVLNGKAKSIGEYKRDRPEFPLRRFVTHSELGLSLTGSFSRGRSASYPYYRFGPKGTNQPKDKFEEKFLLFMDSFAFNQKLLTKLEKFVEQSLNKQTKDSRDRASMIQRKIEDLEIFATALMQKNAKGILTDERMIKQLDIIDIQKSECAIDLGNLKTSGIDVSEAINYARKYVTKPSEVWKEVDLGSKMNLQRFQFPLGLLFDGENFGTTELSSVFKAKSAFEDADSGLVDPTGLEPATPSVQVRCSTR